HASISSVLLICVVPLISDVFALSFFFFNATATTEIYTLSLHDALPIYRAHVVIDVDGDGLGREGDHAVPGSAAQSAIDVGARPRDRKSTRLNSITSGSRMPSSA